MLRKLKIISCGQTGVDRAALDVGLSLGLEIGRFLKKSNQLITKEIEVNMSMQNLASAVINYRGNISIRVAAREIGISPTTLSRLEKGCEPDAKTLEKICAWMIAILNINRD